MIPAPNQSIAITTPEGFMTDSFRLFTSMVAALGIASGAGSPEGVVKAFQLSLYMDTAGVAGSILYIKRDNNIAGDTSQGWILI